MKRAEDILFERFGKRLPYAVPENYFDNFAAQWSNVGQVAVARLVPISRIVRTWLYAAAMFAGVFFMGHFAYNIYNNNKQNNLAENYELYMYSQVADTDIIEYCLTK